MSLSLLMLHRCRHLLCAVELSTPTQTSGDSLAFSLSGAVEEPNLGYTSMRAQIMTISSSACVRLKESVQ